MEQGRKGVAALGCRLFWAQTKEEGEWDERWPQVAGKKEIGGTQWGRDGEIAAGKEGGNKERERVVAKR
ncbi:hypothetical protein AMTR_s00002p00176350 [Amborella trichopoda]|uniref:Uncharacterized protein n=1 Tax=Amborella trichopoda TaxID=13333 RepID=W1NZH3_AMBTC|nr:hypothetical protein AMTR_s00002p00176350 [Amborella trichopoda]